MNSEERILRPYIGVERLQRALDGFSLVVGSEVVEGRTVLPVAQYLTQPINLLFADDGALIEDVRRQLAEGVAESGIEPREVELIVIVSTPRLKRSDIVWRVRGDRFDELPKGVEIANAVKRPFALLTPFGGSRIEVFLVLAEEREPRPLHPWRKGTWLARAEYHVVSDIGEIGFTPIPLTDELREHLGVPRETNRLVRIEASVLDPEIEEEALDLYVDEGVLAQLTQFPDNPGSRLLQKQLFLDAASAIVVEALRSPELAEVSFGDIADSLLGRLVELVADHVSGESPEALKARREVVLDRIRKDPLLFLARLEASLDLRDDYSAAVNATPNQ